MGMIFGLNDYYLHGNAPSATTTTIAAATNIADMATAYDRYHSYCNTTTATDNCCHSF
jgi:hypothetical protein